VTTLGNQLHRPVALAGLGWLVVGLASACPTPGLAAAPSTNAPAKAADKKGAPVKGAPAKGAEAATAPAPTNTPPKVVSIPKSSFLDKRGDGRDPFFPSSERRQVRTDPPVPPPTIVVPVPPVEAVTNTASTATTVIPPPDAPKASDSFSVRGIVGGRKPSALINSGVASYDFFQGDELFVRVKEGIRRVKCIEIKPRAVIIHVEGEKEPREFKMRPDI